MFWSIPKPFGTRRWRRLACALLAAALAILATHTYRARALQPHKRFANLDPDRPQRVARWWLLRRMLGLERTPKPGVERVAWDAMQWQQLTAPVCLGFVGHATFLVRVNGVTFLTDPTWSDRASPVSWTGPKRLVAPGIPKAELPKVDVVLVTHNHYDHLDAATLAWLGQRDRPQFLVAAGLGRWFADHGLDGVREMQWWEQHAHRGVTFTFVPSQHFSSRGLFDRNRTLWGGFVAAAPNAPTLYFAGDTGMFSGFAEIARRYGPVGLALLPIGAYEPAAMMAPIHLKPSETVEAFRQLQAKWLVAMHWGVFDLSAEPTDEPPALLRRHAADAGIAPERLWIPKVGECREVGICEQANLRIGE